MDILYNPTVDSYSFFSNISIHPLLTSSESLRGESAHLGPGVPVRGWLCQHYRCGHQLCAGRWRGYGQQRCAKMIIKWRI